MSQVNATVRIKDVHLRLERAVGEGVSTPAFALGFVLPSAEVDTKVTLRGAEGLETIATVAKAGIYCNTVDLNIDDDGGGAQELVGAVSPGDEGMVAKEGEDQAGVDAGKLTKRERAAAAEAEAAQQKLFFRAQDEIRDRMRAVAQASDSWPAEHWFVLFTPSQSQQDEASDAFMRAVIKKDLSSKAKPSAFEYEEPIQITQVTIGKATVQATEAQLAAIMSLSAHASAFKLWSSYGVVRELHELPRKIVVAQHGRMLWRTAFRAVASALHKEAVSTGNMAKILLDAKK